MKQLALYYSFGGTTRAIAGAFAEENGCEIREIIPKKKINGFKALLMCPKAMAGGTVPIENIDVDFKAYELIHVFAPIWAGNPAPPVNTALGWLPSGASVALNFVSESGKSNKMFKMRDDLKVTAVNDIKSTKTN